MAFVIQTPRSREVLSQHTVLPADDALGRKRSGNVPVVEVVVVSEDKTAPKSKKGKGRGKARGGGKN